MYEQMLLHLREKREAVLKSAEKVWFAAESEDREMTDAETAEYEKLLGEVESLKRRIEHVEKISKLQPSELTIVGVSNLTVQRPHEPATGRHVEVGESPEIKFRNFGEFLRDIRFASLGGGRQVVSPKLERHINKMVEHRAATGAGIDVGSDGGFLVPEEFAELIMKRMDDLGQVRPRATRIPLDGNTLTVPLVDETSRATGSRWGGVQGYWVDEGTAPTASKPKFKRHQLKVRKLAALFYATDELIADTMALGSIAERAFSEELTWLADDAFVNGTGAGQPAGFLNSNAVVSVAKETGQAAATLLYENVVKMYARMWAPSRSRAVWFVNQDIEPQLFTMSLAVGTGGNAVFMPAGGASASPFATLFGRPIVPIEYCATLGTVGDIILADMSQYVYIDKGNPEMASSIHVNFTEDETVFRFIYRVDGHSQWVSALTPANGSNTLSPFISLATRS